MIYKAEHYVYDNIKIVRYVGSILFDMSGIYEIIWSKPLIHKYYNEMKSSSYIAFLR